MLLGCEFPPPPYRTTSEGWEAFTELHPKVAKFRLTQQWPDDVQRARNIMGTGGIVLWRPRRETPTPYQLLDEFNQSVHMVLPGDWLELENEPNHPESRWTRPDRWTRPGPAYMTNLLGLIDVAGQWPVKLVSPGLMVESAPNNSNTALWLRETMRERERCSFQGGHVYHTQGLDGIMYLPGEGEVVTEFGYSGDQPYWGITKNLEVLTNILPRVEALGFFILPYEEGQEEWGKWFLTVGAASAYRSLHEQLHIPQEVPVTDQQKADLRAMLLGVQAELGAQFISNDPQFALNEVANAVVRAKDKLGQAVNYLDTIIGKLPN